MKATVKQLSDWKRIVKVTAKQLSGWKFMLKIQATWGWSKKELLIKNNTYLSNFGRAIYLNAYNYNINKNNM